MPFPILWGRLEGEGGERTEAASRGRVEKRERLPALAASEPFETSGLSRLAPRPASAGLSPPSHSSVVITERQLAQFWGGQGRQTRLRAPALCVSCSYVVVDDVARPRCMRRPRPTSHTNQKLTVPPPSSRATRSAFLALGSCSILAFLRAALSWATVIKAGGLGGMIGEYFECVCVR